MRKRTSIQPYIFLIVSLIVLLNLPLGTVNLVRQTTIAGVSPFWSTLTHLKYFLLNSIFHPFAFTSKGCKEKELSQESFDKLLLENLQLKMTLNKALEPYPVRHPSLAARVLARSISSWNSTLWIDVGEQDNTGLEIPVIAKNSPVVVGTSLIGMVERVGKKQSLVRLITDSQLVIPVRAARGKPQNSSIIEHATALLRHLNRNTPLFNDQNQQQLSQLLQDLISNLEKEATSTFLAKGELSGSVSSQWRRSGHLLKGTGFNYDFSDNEGEARDLRTGQPFTQKQNIPSPPILQKGDLLITTGMDGILPAGLHVAEVTHIDTLVEGAYYYSIEAFPTAGDLEELSSVLVLAPA